MQQCKYPFLLHQNDLLRVHRIPGNHPDEADAARDRNAAVVPAVPPDGVFARVLLN